MREMKPELKIKEFANLCELFNLIKDVDGLAFPPSKDAIKKQSALIVEETKELEEALDSDDLEGVLDANIDILVTALGLLQQLESIQGIDVNKALLDTANNNLSKFIKADGKDADLALKISGDSLQYYAKKLNDPYNVERYMSQDQQYIVLLNKNNKDMKPVGFVPNNLEHCFSQQAYAYWGSC